MKIEADGYSFDFTNAIDAFVFDERDSSKPTFHGVPMKAVDLLVELEDKYLFIEVKDIHELGKYNNEIIENFSEVKEEASPYKRMKNYLKYKFRDTYLYRHAEDKVDKPILYLCLLNFDNAMSFKLSKDLKIELPTGQSSSRWNKTLAASCFVMNLDFWNKKFTAWPVSTIAGNP